VVFTSIKNLVIVVHNEYYDPADFVDIGNRVAKRAPDIRPYVVGATATDSDIPAAVWQWPALTVAFGRSAAFRPRRGAIMCNRQIGKLEQADILRDAGIAVPHCKLFQIGMELDPALWGDFVLLKPESLEHTSHSADIQLFRRARLAAMKPVDFPANHFALCAPMIVQRFIDTGPNPGKFRALVFCGEVLYLQSAIIAQERPSLNSSNEALEAALVGTSGSVPCHYHHEDRPEIVQLAKRVATAFPGIPLMGVDIIRDVNDGKLYVLEINAGGNVWHFSSPMWAERRKMYPEAARGMHEQYGAFDVAAKALISATRRLAV
jgi:hypothetical protein